jgi:TPR repeat protein
MARRGYGTALAACLALAGCSGPSFDKGAQAYRAGDYEGALKQWEPLAEKGDVRAQVDAGNLYNDGKGVERDPAKAAHWYRLAAERGDPDGEAALGTLYMTGQGAPQDFAQARAWFAKAAAQDQPVAAYDLATLYDTGEGGPVDKVKAVQFYAEAAELGDDTAAMNLGVQYANGEGAAVDMNKAYKWTAVAARSKDPEVKARAQANLVLMAHQMAPADIEASQQAALAFKPRVRKSAPAKPS